MDEPPYTCETSEIMNKLDMGEIPETPAKEQGYGPLDAAACSAWRDPKTDPPTKTGKILVWLHGVGPSLVNVEERWMAYWNGHDETCPTDPDEWDLWAEINKADDPGMAAGAAVPPLKSD
jgi:hypothetical protein